jgi:hypothetical protein
VSIYPRTFLGKVKEISQSIAAVSATNTVDLGYVSECVVCDSIFLELWKIHYCFGCQKGVNLVVGSALGLAAVFLCVAFFFKKKKLIWIYIFIFHFNTFSEKT